MNYVKLNFKVYKSLAAFLGFLRGQFLLTLIFLRIFFSHISKYLKIHQLPIIKQKYGCEQYKHFPADVKQNLAKY